MKSEFDRDRAALDVLLKQYEFLREEITRCIYLEHIAILGLYTFLGLVIASLIKEEILKSMNDFDPNKYPLLLFLLVFAQVIICGFGSLFLKEQARNRRACSFLRALEDVINNKIGEIGIYWENFITSPFLNKYPINPQYYLNRLLSVGLPIFLSNLFITSGIIYTIHRKANFDSLIVFFLILIGALAVLYFLLPFLSPIFNGKGNSILVFHIIIFIAILSYEFYEKDNLIPFAFLSVFITFFWALTLAFKTHSSLTGEKVPCKLKILEWLEKEKSELLHRNITSNFTLKGDEVELEIHVVKRSFSGVIYDIEIFPGDQNPPWQSIEDIRAVKLPEDWDYEHIGKGVRFYTRRNPLRKCEPEKFKFRILPPQKTVKFIQIHLSDKNCKIIGEIVSQLIT
jgi:hypothetical protein